MYIVTLLDTGDEEYFATAALALVRFGTIMGEEDWKKFYIDEKKRKQLEKFVKGKRDYFDYQRICIDRVKY